MINRKRIIDSNRKIFKKVDVSTITLVFVIILSMIVSCIFFNLLGL